MAEFPQFQYLLLYTTHVNYLALHEFIVGITKKGFRFSFPIFLFIDLFLNRFESYARTKIALSVRHQLVLFYFHPCQFLSLYHHVSRSEFFSSSAEYKRKTCTFFTSFDDGYDIAMLLVYQQILTCW